MRPFLSGLCNCLFGRYNTYGFDCKYIYERAKQFDMVEFPFTRFEQLDSEFKVKNLESGALGSNTYEYFTYPGCLNVDLITIIRRDHKLESYKLDRVAELFLKDNKHDVSPAQIFEWSTGTDIERGKVAAYCIQDTLLPLRLVFKLNVIANLVSYANISCVPIDFIIFRGQQIKVYSSLAELAVTENYTIPKLPQGLSENASYMVRAPPTKPYSLL